MTDRFYKDLPLQKTKISDIVAQEESFSIVPPDWHIVITDIKGSTKAVQEGKQELVNLIATGSIIAALNLAQTKQLKIPYFFGGDGATLLIPSSIFREVMQALREHRNNTFQNFGLDLRVGSVPVEQVYAAGNQLKIAKVRFSNIRSIPIILGKGLHYAERLVKGNDHLDYAIESQQSTLNLEGMECRWDRIKPPEQINEVVCLLVDVPSEEQHAQLFSEILSGIDHTYGPRANRQPISVQKLKLNPSFEKVQRETVTKFGQFRVPYLISTWLMLQFGNLYFKIRGQKYLSILIDLSDTLVLDGRINTVISGNPKQRLALTQRLDELESKGLLHYGIHASGESILSCYVRNDLEQRVHFVDGSEGGYTQAAKMLKRKLGATNDQ